MFRHASTISCQMLPVKCLNYLAPSFVAICQILCHFQTSSEQKLLTQASPLLVEKLELNNDVGEARHLAWRTHKQAALLFPQPFWMLLTMLFKVRKQLAVFSPSLGVCPFLLIWGIAPEIELHRFRHPFPRPFFPDAFSSPDLLLAAFPLSAHWRENREKERDGEGEREREKKREGEKRRAPERERERVLERACGCVVLVEIQQVSKVLVQTFFKVHACCHDNIFPLLAGYRSSRFPIAPHRTSQKNLKVTAAEYNIATYHLLTLAIMFHWLQINFANIISIRITNTLYYINKNHKLEPIKNI